ncbi:hypothetical protein IMZ48_33005 [Candidatus Bathyarchaeota archaeon]|nr:hypothetical protein [Candidatus Bathyarchaeota archaeon]
MAAPTSALSQTLKSISLTKIREISKQRAVYEQRKDAVLAEAALHASDPHARIARLYQGVEDLYPSGLSDNGVHNVRYWLQQSRYDASVPAGTLASCEELLRGKLEVQSRRLAIAHLYSRLVTEWIKPGAPIGGEEPAAEDDEFEVVDRQKERLQELCDRFERVVFTPLETDETEIDLYMTGLFPGDDAQKALTDLRDTMLKSSEHLMDSKVPFDKETLTWSINALLSEDLLSDAKQAILREFLGNDLVLGEIADVLNMRYADFASWEWDAGPDGIPVLPRPQLNGKYRIWMDEDVLQAIFVEYVGVRCCNLLSTNLKDFLNVNKSGAWRWAPGTRMSDLDKLRRTYYLGMTFWDTNSVSEVRQKDYNRVFFMSQLPATPTALGAGAYVNDGAVDDDEQAKGWSNIKQQLLRTLASEMLVHRTLHGEAAVVQSDLQWYATGLSHSTIFSVMRFFGFPEKMIAFYRKVLEAPLNMAPADGSPGGPRTRRRGVPMAHATEKFIGELVLFVMDLVVNRETGMLLYRLHDDIFLVGEPERCAKAWEALGAFAKVMGLDFNMHKTGSVYLTDGTKKPNPKISSILPSGTVQIGHLTLDAESGEWVIDQKQVGEHVAQLKLQLAASGSVLGWVQTWNSCIGRFFSHTFGEPAYCFGRAHVDGILEAYRRMNVDLFGDGGSAVRYLKSKIQERFNVTEVPDAFLLLPEKLGGLGLQNPFISLLTVRDKLSDWNETPEQILREALRHEREMYEAARKDFYEVGGVPDRIRRLREEYRDGDEYKEFKHSVYESIDLAERENFFSLEEYTRFRETTSMSLAKAYRLLATTPEAEGPIVDRDVKTILAEIDIDSYDKSPRAMEARWALQMFGDGLRDTVGALRLVEDNLLPLGVLTMMRQKAVRWNMVL